FWHRGEPIEHARTLAVLHQGIHRAPDGRWATRIGKDWAYLDVEDAALFVRRIEGHRAQLASGEWAEIESLASGADDALYARVRKSTRLNSSHVAISYAVFCLKKKKKKNTR